MIVDLLGPSLNVNLLLQPAELNLAMSIRDAFDGFFSGQNRAFIFDGISNGLIQIVDAVDMVVGDARNMNFCWNGCGVTSFKVSGNSLTKGVKVSKPL